MANQKYGTKADIERLIKNTSGDNAGLEKAGKKKPAKKKKTKK